MLARCLVCPRPPGLPSSPFFVHGAQNIALRGEALTEQAYIADSVYISHRSPQPHSSGAFLFAVTKISRKSAKRSSSTSSSRPTLVRHPVTRRGANEHFLTSSLP